jgi:hypothetical protein
MTKVTRRRFNDSVPTRVHVESPAVYLLGLVNWNYNATARELRSAEEILTAQNNGELEIARTNILINSPAIKLRQ